MFNEAVNKVVQAKDKVIDELRKKEQEMDEEVKVTKGQLETHKLCYENQGSPCH